MKLIKQTLLGLTEGSSDKVYEVDLCEVAPGQCVVNFRYGRRGTALKEGTKTDAPVGRAAAIKVFDALVSSKVKGGYSEEGSKAAAPAPVAAVASERERGDARGAAITRHLGPSQPQAPSAPAAPEPKPGPLAWLDWERRKTLRLLRPGLTG